MSVRDDFVRSWLNVSSSYAPGPSATPSPRTTRPHARPAQRDTALTEMDGNFSPRRGRGGGSKRRYEATIEAKAQHGAVVNDLDVTPRPIRRAKTASASDVSSSSDVAPSDSVSNPPSSNARSTSPVKRIGELALRANPVLLRHIDDPGHELPIGLKEMMAVFKRHGRGVGVVDASCKAEIEATAKHHRGFEMDEDAYAGADASSRASLGRLGSRLSATLVAKILGLARRCEQDGHGEAEWNGRVHSRLLEEGLAPVPQVDFLNCTTADIRPRSLIAPHHAGRPGEGKMVDFVICVEPDERAMAAIRRWASRCPSSTDLASVNHTWHTPLRTRPISVSVETKRTGENWDTALVQLGVWVAAHFSKLRLLLTDAEGDVRNLPSFLPLIVAQGHSWNFLAASQSDSQTIIWERIYMGDTTSALGVHSIAATLRHLAEWTHTVYRPWFYLHVLGMQPKDFEPTLQPSASGETMDQSADED